MTEAATRLDPESQAQLAALLASALGADPASPEARRALAAAIVRRGDWLDAAGHAALTASIKTLLPELVPLVPLADRPDLLPDEAGRAALDELREIAGMPVDDSRGRHPAVERMMEMETRTDPAFLILGAVVGRGGLATQHDELAELVGRFWLAAVGDPDGQSAVLTWAARWLNQLDSVPERRRIALAQELWGALDTVQNDELRRRLWWLVTELIKLGGKLGLEAAHQVVMSPAARDAELARWTSERPTPAVMRQPLFARLKTAKPAPDWAAAHATALRCVDPARLARDVNLETLGSEVTSWFERAGPHDDLLQAASRKAGMDAFHPTLSNARVTDLAPLEPDGHDPLEYRGELHVTAREWDEEEKPVTGLTLHLFLALRRDPRTDAVEFDLHSAEVRAGILTVPMKRGPAP